MIRVTRLYDVVSLHVSDGTVNLFSTGSVGGHFRSFPNVGEPYALTASDVLLFLKGIDVALDHPDYRPRMDALLQSARQALTGEYL